MHGGQLLVSALFVVTVSLEDAWDTDGQDMSSQVHGVEG